MGRLTAVLLVLLALAAPAAERGPVNTWTGVTPSGSCTGSRIVITPGDGLMYSCIAGSWAPVGSSGAGGNVDAEYLLGQSNIASPALPNSRALQTDGSLTLNRSVAGQATLSLNAPLFNRLGGIMGTTGSSTLLCDQGTDTLLRGYDAQGRMVCGFDRAHDVQDEGVAVTPFRPTLNFTGAGVTVTDLGSKTTVNIPGGAGSAYATVQSGGSALTQRPTLNINGNTGVTVADDAANNRTNINIASIMNGVYDDGSIMAFRPGVNFTGAAIDCVDNAGSSRIDCTVPWTDWADITSKPSTFAPVDATSGVTGGLRLTGDLGGTAASPSVVDDSHAHTSSTISGLDAANDISSGLLAGARGGGGAALPTCSGTDKLTANGTVWSCAADQTSAGGGYATIRDNGTDETQRSALNFIAGTGVTLNVADDAANGETEVTINASGGSGPANVILASNTNTNTTAPANLSGMFFSLAATTKYHLYCLIGQTSTSTSLIRYGFTFGGTTTTFNGRWERHTTTTGNNANEHPTSITTQTSSLTSGVSATRNQWEFNAIFTTGTGGTLQLQHFVSTAAQTNTTHAGSACTLTTLP